MAGIRIWLDGNGVRVEVVDVGKGIKSEKHLEMGTAGEAGVGLRGMYERIHQLGGTVAIAAAANGRGAKLSACVPFARPGTGDAIKESLEHFLTEQSD